MKSNAHTFEPESPRKIYLSPLRFLALVAALVALPTGLISGCLYYGQRTLDAEIARIRAAGVPTNEAELDAWQPRLSDADNAAFLLERAWKTSPKFKKSFFPSYLDLLERGSVSKTAWPDLRAEIREELTEKEAYFGALRDAAGCKGYRIQPDTAAIGIARNRSNEYDEIVRQFRDSERNLASLAVFEADIGSRDAALTDLTAAIRFSDLLRTEPSWIFQDCRRDLHLDAFRAVRITLMRHDFSDAQLGDVAAALDDLYDSDSAYRIFAGELCWQLTHYRHINSRATYESALNPVYLAAPWFFASALEAPRLAITASRLAPAARRREFNDMRSSLANAEIRKQLLPMHVSIYNPYRLWDAYYYQHYLDPLDVDAALLALTRVGVAATRYRIAHGDWPEQLDALAPQYLDQLPEDPFDGKPLRYVRRDSEILLCSVGPDLKDNGGIDGYDSHFRSRNCDITLTLTPPSAANED